MPASNRPPTPCLAHLLRHGLTLALVAGGLLASAGELQIDRVFGPEIKTGPYKHPARVEELANGDLYLVYYGGEGEYATDTGVFGSRLTPDRKSTRLNSSHVSESRMPSSA